MKHIIFYSGGVGSWATSIRVKEKYGIDDLILLFTDTLIEDDDLYRFLIESSSNTFDIQGIDDLLNLCNSIPDISYPEERKDYLLKLANEVMKKIPSLYWIADGRNPWEVYKDERFLGNSHIAKCSHILKQKTARVWINNHFNPSECILYLGIDWTEIHRTKAPTKHWSPYKVEFPMIEAPYLSKDDFYKMLKSYKIKRPLLYDLGFSHNNCGGFCCRAGQGHYANFLEKLPDRFRYHEMKEEEMLNFLDRDDIAMLTRIKDKKKEPFPLSKLREEFYQDKMQIDLFDIGGCGCFVDYD